jgi:N-acetylglucosaminyldiphosphoundecaprenol N-acetyl-beta-D-mannosaminyltransferase
MNNENISPVSKIFGIPVNAITMEQTLDFLNTKITAKKKIQIGVVNAAKIVNMKRNPLLGEDVLSSDIILADGAAVVWASRILKKPLPERIAGIDLMFALMERGKTEGYRIFCFGATEEISLKIAANIKRDYPGLILAGRRNGYFSKDEEEEIAEQIANSKPDILFVAITSPKKEQFLARWSDKMGVPICHGVGGSFDVYAGKVKRAPELWQRLGLEWFYRLIQEPGRMWKRYLITNSLFCKMLLIEYFKKR